MLMLVIVHRGAERRASERCGRAAGASTATGAARPSSSGGRGAVVIAGSAVPACTAATAHTRKDDDRCLSALLLNGWSGTTPQCRRDGVAVMLLLLLLLLLLASTKRSEATTSWRGADMYRLKGRCQRASRWGHNEGGRERGRRQRLRAAPLLGRAIIVVIVVAIVLSHYSIIIIYTNEKGVVVCAVAGAVCVGIAVVGSRSVREGVGRASDAFSPAVAERRQVVSLVQRRGARRRRERCGCHSSV